MWKKVAERLKGYPERLSVAKVLIENGLRVDAGKIYCNDIKIPAVRISRVAKVDRRTVLETIKAIEENLELKTIFKNLRSAGHSLKEIAKYLDLGVVEITSVNAKMPGILAKSASLIAFSRPPIFDSATVPNQLLPL